MSSTAVETPDGPAMAGRSADQLGAALRIELRKLTTTRIWWALGLAAIVVAVLVTVLTVAGANGSQHSPLDIFTGR